MFKLNFHGKKNRIFHGIGDGYYYSHWRGVTALSIAEKRQVVLVVYNSKVKTATIGKRMDKGNEKQMITEIAYEMLIIKTTCILLVVK